MVSFKDDCLKYVKLEVIPLIYMADIFVSSTVYFLITESCSLLQANVINLTEVIIDILWIFIYIQRKMCVCVCN